MGGVQWIPWWGHKLTVKGGLGDPLCMLMGTWSRLSIMNTKEILCLAITLKIESTSVHHSKSLGAVSLWILIHFASIFGEVNNWDLGAWVQIVHLRPILTVTHAHTWTWIFCEVLVNVHELSSYNWKIHPKLKGNFWHEQTTHSKKMFICGEIGANQWISFVVGYQYGGCKDS